MGSETTVVTRSVSQIIDHPNYQSGSERNDISLLKLSSPVTVWNFTFFLSFQCNSEEKNYKNELKKKFYLDTNPPAGYDSLLSLFFM